jgi:hypothetical protein
LAVKVAHHLLDQSYQLLAELMQQQQFKVLVVQVLQQQVFDSHRAPQVEQAQIAAAGVLVRFMEPVEMVALVVLFFLVAVAVLMLRAMVHLGQVLGQRVALDIWRKVELLERFLQRLVLVVYQTEICFFVYLIKPLTVLAGEQAPDLGEMVV